MKKSLILINSFKEKSLSLGEEINVFLSDKGYDSTLYSYNGKDAVGKSVDVDFSPYSLVVTLGGDGTVLFACRSCAPLGIPVFAINLGEFGFLANISVDSWKKELLDYIENRSEIQERYLVQAEIVRDGKTFASYYGMNDVVISGSSSTRLINMNVAYNHAFLGPFKASGIIVASATGSTAFSAAEGGPIIDPNLASMVLTPISSFSLSARPLVFGSKGELAITVLPSRADVAMTVDGQIEVKLEVNDVVIIGVSECRASLIGATQEKFYSALQSKLNWSGGPRA